jgi:hypothetical protein
MKIVGPVVVQNSSNFPSSMFIESSYSVGPIVPSITGSAPDTSSVILNNTIAESRNINEMEMERNLAFRLLALAVPEYFDLEPNFHMKTPLFGKLGIGLD